MTNLSIGSSEYNKIIYEWNKTERPYPEDKTIHELFEEQVERTPDNIAVVYEDKQLTYRELNYRANQLAHYLRDNYVIKGDDLIALCLERSEFMLIAILGILKSGAAYVPIDPNYPDERISFILTDTRAKVVITNAVIPARARMWQAGFQYSALASDSKEIQEELSKQPSQNPSLNITSHNLAYVIYTSGTTGVPKGVMIEHKSVVNTLFALNEVYNLTTGNKVSAYTSYVFDVSVSEFFIPLLNGAELFVLSDLIRTDIDKLSAYLSGKQINIAYIPPVLLPNLSPGDLPQLERIIYAGEPCGKPAGKTWSGHLKLFNCYGPTEASIYSIGKQVIDGDTNLIGKPLHNNNAYILNEYLQPVSVGVIGELYIGGVGLARGYLNRPDLTSERFISNPFQTDAELAQGKNCRLYKTGDLVRYLPDGNIEYIGRNDDQVKIRGYRIELGEVEAALSNIPEIMQACVLVKERLIRNENIKYLVGYYVSVHKLNQDDILIVLSKSIPEYMLPEHLIQLESLPLTVNGKLDRKALPDPEFSFDDDYQPPRNELESKICTVYSHILGIEIALISIQDNFFKLGGNSVLAIRLTHRLNTGLDIFITIADIYRLKTIARLAAHIVTITKKNIVIPPSTKMDKYPLSFAQERLWFIEEYEQGTNVYHMPLLLQLDDKVELSTLVSSMQAIVSRHEVLRSTFTADDSGVDYQVVHDTPLEVKLIDCITQAEYKRLLADGVNAPFDLRNVYPLRACIYLVSEQSSQSEHISERYLLINLHHIAGDGWSFDILLRELWIYYTYYQQLAQGNINLTQPDLPELSIQYKDFAVWQRDYLSGDELQKQLCYWQTRLAGYEILNLATDKPRPLNVSYSGGRVNFSLGEELSAKLRNLSRTQGYTMYTLLLAGFYVLLHKYSNQKDIIVGSPTANRHYTSLQDLIGFFVNMLVQREQLELDQPISTLIEQIHQHLVEAQLHQDIPFEKLVDELQVERDTSRHPLFQIMFTVQSFGDGIPAEFSELFRFDNSLDELHQITRFDLECFIDDSAHTISGQLLYATSLYHAATIERMVEHYQNILTLMVDEPARILKNYQILSPAEYQTIVYDWNKTEQPYPENKTIQELFEEQVERTPDNIAVVYEDKQLTYSELNQKANQLAHYLRENYSIKGDDLIALCLDRSEQMIIAILGVLKSGAAYVPIDPNYPDERIGFILTDTKAKVLLTNHEYEKRFSSDIQVNTCVWQAGIQLPLLVIDNSELQKQLYSQPTQNPVFNISCHNLAYVIYTSGTSGMPKGVLQQHNNIHRLLLATERWYHFKSNDVWTLFHSYAFDFSVWEIWGALCYGAKLVIPGNTVIHDPNLFYALCARYEVTILNQTPTAFYSLIAAAQHQKNKLHHLRIVIFGGESLNPEYLKPWLKLYSYDQPKLVNMYGITEITVHASYKLIDHDMYIHPFSIGCKLPDQKIYVLDSNRQPLPIGVVGELYIGGAGLARGYLNRPDLTPEKFITNPFQTDAQRVLCKNSRLYKTGDLVRYLPDGNIEYIGRNDTQVKIRGYRIELGEIETVLSRITGIAQVCVVVKQHKNENNKFLVAYYVATLKLNNNELRAYLSEYLPDYMLPNHLIQLESLPLTVNGKLDRSALLKMDLVILNKNYIAPQTYAEIQLQQIFAQVLGLPAEQISIDDDFFKLGGNSLLTIKLVNRINQELNLKLKIFDIFHKKTIQAIATNSSDGLIEYAEYYTPRFRSYSIDTPIFIFIPGFHDGFERNYTDLINTLQVDNSQQIYLFKNCFESFGNYEDVAKYYCDIIDKLALQNIVLCGYSSGGVIAYLMAARLVKQRPLKLVLFDTYFNVDNSYLRAKRFIRKRLKMAVGEHSRLNYIPQIDVPILFFKATLDEASRNILASDRRFRWLRQIQSDIEYIVSQCIYWFKSGRLPNHIQKHMQIYKIIELEAQHTGEQSILSRIFLPQIKMNIDDFLKK